jgi:phosphate starvation-inducible PhoH-like protein
MLQHDITFLTGPAGSSKTFMATAFAIDQILRKRPNEDGFEWIVMTRPTVDAGERLGFLPGNFEAKVSPYLQPIVDTIDKLVEKNSKEMSIIKASMRIRPLAYMRGLTFDNSVAILDEAQNVTKEQMKLWLSRIGKGTKMIVCGDDSQTDLKESCLIQTAQLLRGMKGFAHVRMSENAIVRHEIIKPMMDRLSKL